MHASLDIDVPAAEASIQPVPGQDLPGVRSLALTFTGSGKEYFRIWILNLLLTVATLGIYSAWAKVRRLQYFDRNTQLAGASFDFDGEPRAILKGRLLAVVLLAAYHYSFGFSMEVGVAIAAGLALALPFLMRAALRFRLSHTRYRGLPFGFCGSIRGAYKAYLPPVATVLLPGVLFSIYPDGVLTVSASLLYLAWPVMHGAMKGYQHRHLQYGNRQARYGLTAGRFVRPYLMAGLLLLLGGIASALVAVGAAKVFWPKGGGNDVDIAGTINEILFFALPIYIMFLLAGPYLQVRVANLAWSNTSFEIIRIQSTMTARGMIRLQVVNTLLTLLTLGLYRPFAVVRVYQYRLAHLALEVQGEFEDIVAGAEPRHAGAAGDGGADFLGVDLSW